jgi:hypothetical protein
MSFINLMMAKKKGPKHVVAPKARYVNKAHWQ